MQLVLNLVLLFLWIKPIVAPWSRYLGTDEGIIYIRYMIVMIMVGLSAYTYKYEIESYMSKSFELLRSLVGDPSNEN